MMSSSLSAPASSHQAIPIVSSRGGSDFELQRLFASKLQALMLPIQLSLTMVRNRTTVLSVRREHDIYYVRMNPVFLGADDTLLLALSRFVLRHDVHASKQIQQFFSQQAALESKEQCLTTVVQDFQPAGMVYDLGTMMDWINQRYFDNSIQASITWGPRNTLPRVRKSIRLGSYLVEDRLIRIHPALDQSFVPAYFVEWVIYHEMLHQKHHIPVINGRRQFHSKAFRLEEKLFEEYDRARLWEKHHIYRLLSY